MGIELYCFWASLCTQQEVLRGNTKGYMIFMLLTGVLDILGSNWALLYTPCPCFEKYITDSLWFQAGNTILRTKKLHPGGRLSLMVKTSLGKKEPGDQQSNEVWISGRGGGNNLWGLASSANVGSPQSNFVDIYSYESRSNSLVGIETMSQFTSILHFHLTFVRHDSIKEAAIIVLLALMNCRHIDISLKVIEFARNKCPIEWWTTVSRTTWLQGLIVYIKFEKKFSLPPFLM